MNNLSVSNQMMAMVIVGVLLLLAFTLDVMVIQTDFFDDLSDTQSRIILHGMLGAIWFLGAHGIQLLKSGIERLGKKSPEAPEPEHEQDQ